MVGDTKSTSDRDRVSTQLHSAPLKLMNNAAVREEMGRQSELNVLCETGWASREDSLNVFVSSLQVSSLSIIQLQWHEKAQNATSEHNVRREIVLINGPPCA